MMLLSQVVWQWKLKYMYSCNEDLNSCTIGNGDLNTCTFGNGDLNTCTFGNGNLNTCTIGNRNFCCCLLYGVVVVSLTHSPFLFSILLNICQVCKICFEKKIRNYKKILYSLNDCRLKTRLNGQVKSYS